MYAVDMTTSTTFDQAAARRRRFDGGMPVHDDADAIVRTRVAWIANVDEREQQRFCPRCTAYKAVCVPVCTACAQGR